MVIRVVASTGSTNADLLAAARSGGGEGWLRAERQTGGRGRLQRAWVSPRGNLHASTLVRLVSGDPPAQGLALVAGVALHDAASAYVPAGALRLKWPNDLLADDAKLAGILLEREGSALVIGFGVNLASHPQDLGRSTTDLSSLTGSAPDPDEFLHTLVDAFARWCGRWRAEGLEPARRRWLEKAHPIGSALSTTGPDGQVRGLFDGLEPDGALRLRQADGRIEVIRAGDVELV